MLEKAELVLSRKEGRTRWNPLNAAPIQHIHSRWISSYATNAVRLLTRLKRDLEGD
ncbi:hypothetical protein [Corallococcus sp. RDP092CA]|uniref:hypothetical protein n=1 Tax=Corallococcus sp. RDP092CA TaxID=3109369 RepID=UPI0035AF4218